MRVQTVLLTGLVGAGKTSADEIMALLEEQGLPYAGIDLDWLCQRYPAPVDDLYNRRR